MKNFKWLFVILFLLILISIVDVVNVNAQERDLSNVGGFIDNWMEKQVEKEHIPNAVVTVVHKGEVIFSKGYGLTSLETKEAVDPDASLFRIGSISKLFTWIAVMQLVEQGELDLDTDINEFMDFEILEGPDNSDSITLRHLMTHTPGFEDYVDAIFLLNEDELLPLAQYVREFLPERVYPAGDIIAYSNYGTALAGYIVEHISGMPYEEYIEKNIYDSLQMENSTFRQPVPEKLQDQMTQSYRYVDGEFLPGEFEYVPTPAGAMSSSATDIGKFMKAILENDERILQFDTFKEMKKEQFSHHPYLDGMTLGFMERTMNDKRLLMHGGSTMLYDSGLYLLPEEDFGIFVSYSGGSYLTHTKLINEVMDHYFPVLVSESPKASEGMKKRAKQFTGEYHQNRRSFTTSEKLVTLLSGTIQVKVDNEGYLLVSHMGSTNPFVEIEDGVYRNLNEEQLDPYGEFATIVFIKDKNGITHLMTDGPMSYSKAPWYGTSGLTFLSLIGSILIVIISFFYWGIAWLIKLIKKRKNSAQTQLAFWSKTIAIIYSIFTFLFLIGFLLNGELSPIYGLPISAYTIEPTWMIVFEIIPYLLLILSPILLVLILLNWRHKSIKIVTKIHLTVFMFSTLVLSILFYYWNII